MLPTSHTHVHSFFLRVSHCILGGTTVTHFSTVPDECVYPLHRVQRLCCPGTPSQSLITARSINTWLWRTFETLNILGSAYLRELFIIGARYYIYCSPIPMLQTGIYRFRGAQRGAQKVLIHLYREGREQTSYGVPFVS